MVRHYLFSYLKIGKDFFSKYGKSLSLNKSFSLTKFLSFTLRTSLALASLTVLSACACVEVRTGGEGGSGGGGGTGGEGNVLSSLTLEIGGVKYDVDFDNKKSAQISVRMSKLAPPNTDVVSNLKLSAGATAKDTSNNPIIDGSSIPMPVIGDTRKVEINVTDKGGTTRIYTITIVSILDDITVVTLSGHTGNVVSIAYNPDGSRLASGSLDNTIEIWDANKLDDSTLTTPLIATLSGHSAWIISVAFSPDGSRLASGSWDNTVKIWR